MNRLLNLLLAPFRAYIKAYEDMMKEVMEMEEPYRSILLQDMLEDKPSF